MNEAVTIVFFYCNSFFVTFSSEIGQVCEDKIRFSGLGYIVKKYLALFLVISMVSGMGIITNAASLYGCFLDIGSGSNGVIISYTTQFSATASEIGVRDIVLYEKINGVWHTYNIPQGSRTGTSSYSGGGTYTNAVRGRTYKVKCTHYAVYNGVTYTLNSESTEFVYN